MRPSQKSELGIDWFWKATFYISDNSETKPWLEFYSGFRKKKYFYFAGIKNKKDEKVYATIINVNSKTALFFWKTKDFIFCIINIGKSDSGTFYFHIKHSNFWFGVTRKL